MINVIQPHHNPELTIMVPFTRRWMLDRFLARLDDLVVPRQSTELVFYLDSADRDFAQALIDWQVERQHQYDGLYVYRSMRPPTVEHSVIPRRNRIVQVHTDLQSLVHGRFLMGLEDDTIVPLDAYTKMMDDWLNHTGNPGFIEGAEANRWGLRVLGAWKVDDTDDPTVVETVPFVDNQLVPIDGGGMFCFLTQADLYRTHDFRWEAECLGPDMLFGLDLRRKGYDCLLDTSIICEHITESGIIKPSEDTIGIAVWEKFRDNWKMIS